MLCLILALLMGCAKVRAITEVPEIQLGDPSFFPTIEAYADAPIIGANKIDILQNGDELFPAMLRDIKSAKSTITFAQYLFKGGTLARELAQSFADRCRAGVKVYILLDDHGSSEAPDESRRSCARPAVMSTIFAGSERPKSSCRGNSCNIIIGITGASSSSTDASVSPAVTASATTGWATAARRITGATPTCALKGRR